MADTKTPIKIGIFCSLVDVVLALILLQPLQYRGIAWAFVIARTLKVVLLGVVLHRRVEGAFGSDMLDFTARLALCTVGLWATLQLLLHFWPFDAFPGAVLARVVVPAVGGGLVFAACSSLLRIEEFKAVAALVRHGRAAVKMLSGGPNGARNWNDPS